MNLNVKQYVAQNIREHTSTDEWATPNVMRLVDACDYVVLLERHNSLENALKKISAIEDEMFGDDWEEIERARDIAKSALKGNKID